MPVLIKMAWEMLEKNIQTKFVMVSFLTNNNINYIGDDSNIFIHIASFKNNNTNFREVLALLIIGRFVVKRTLFQDALLEVFIDFNLSNR